MSQIPITLVTGFLGAGKTSLINYIIKENKYLKLGVILNEFGDVALESNFLKSNDEEVIEIPNGCMCCVAKKDFVGALDKVMEFQPDTDYIVIEASGISDPLQILLTFYSPLLRERFKLDSILCVVDAVNYDYTMDNYDIASEQIATSDLILLSKTNGIEPQTIKRIESAILGLNSKAKILTIDQDLDLSLIMDTSKFDYDTHESAGNSMDEPEHVHENINDLIFKSSQPLDYQKLTELYKSLDRNIIRSKGFINFKNSPNQDKKYLMQYVGNRVELTFEDWKSTDTKQTVLLFVGKEFDREKLLSDLNNCIAN